MLTDRLTRAVWQRTFTVKAGRHVSPVNDGEVMQFDSSVPPGTPPVRSWMTALVMTTIGVLLIAGFIAIGAVLHIVPVYAGLLLLWYWTSVAHSDLRALAPAVIGGLVGAGLSYLLQTGAAMGNVAVIVAALVLMIVVLFVVIAGRLPLICNASTMLYITVFNAPALQKAEDFRQVIVATVLGLIWFGVCIGLLERLARRPAVEVSAGIA